MANPLADRIRTLTLDKIDFVDDGVEVVLDGVVSNALSLDDAGDAFTLLAAGDADLDDVANGLVDLADLFDDVNLSPAQVDQLNNAVDRILKTGTAEQKQAAKDLFAATLGFGLKAKAANDFFDALLSGPTEG